MAKMVKAIAVMATTSHCHKKSFVQNGHIGKPHRACRRIRDADGRRVCRWESEK